MSLFLALVAVLVVALGGFWLAFTKAGRIRTAGAGRLNSLPFYHGAYAALWAAIPALLLLAMWVVGIGTGTWSNFGPYFSELFPTRLRNTAMGTVYNAARGVQAAAPIVVHAISETHRLAGGISLAAGFAFMAAAWVWTLPETRGRVITHDE